MKKRLLADKLEKAHLLYFVLVSWVFSFLLVFFTFSFNPHVLNIIFLSVMESINFLILGYSFRLKKKRAGKRISAGSLMLVVGFGILYTLELLQSSPTTISLAGQSSAMILEPYSFVSMLLNVLSTLILLSGYIYLLLGFKEVVSK